MTIDTLTPVANSQVDPGDSISFRVDNTYTTITVTVLTATGYEVAYDSALSGAQAGYIVAVEDLGSRDEFTVTRSAGWNVSPFTVRVVENESGSSVTTSTAYTLATANEFPQDSDPYYYGFLSDSFLSHSDTPNTYSGEGGKFAKVKATEDGIEFVAAAGVVDADAIHDNVAGEINAVAEKVTPVSADLVLIEDSADSNNKKKVQVGNLPGGAGAWDALTGTASEVPFNTSPTSPSTAEGTVFWDADDHCLAFKPDVSASTMQVGQENWVRVYNDTVSTITNGSIVYISGAEGVEGRPTIAPAQADSAATSKVVGAVTADITASSFGYVTQFGLIRDVNTAGFTPGTPVYLSDTSPGGYTETEPASPNFSVFLGYSLVADAVNGVGFITTLGNTGSTIAGSADLLTIPARKGSAGTITTGQAVYISGYNVGQSVLEVELADADGTGTMPALGLATGSITNSTNGNVVVSGVISNVNTGAWSVGDALYVSDTAGALTNVRPLDGSQVQKVGTVARSNASNGRIHVTGAGRSNDITNSLRLPEQADHLNTPATGYGELWLKNGTEQDIVLTDEAGDDREVVTRRAADTLAANQILRTSSSNSAQAKADADLTYTSGSLNLLATSPLITIGEHPTAPGTPSAGEVAVYAKADGLLYSKDDAGVETLVSGGAGGGGGTNAQEVTIWTTAAESDLDNVAGTTPAAAKLAVNAGLASSITEIKVHESLPILNAIVDANNELISAIQVGDEIHVGSAISYVTATIDTIALATNVYTYGVTVIASSGTFLASTTNRVSFGRKAGGVDINSLTSATVASGDLVLIEDISDSNNRKKVTAQSIADLGGGGGSGSLTLASYSNVAVDATEVVIGGGYIDGSTGGTYSWNATWIYNDGGGASTQDAELRLYNDAGLKVSTLLLDSSVVGLNTLTNTNQALTAGATPTLDGDIILNSTDIYEVRLYITATGSLDSVTVLSCEFVEA